MTTSFTTSTYNLNTVKAALSSVSNLRMTGVARRGAVSLGMDDSDIVNAIQSLKISDFYKTMASEKMPQYGNMDVYKTNWNGQNIYMKFQNIAGFIVVSFKQDESV